jgi:hypothetical protein
LSWFHSEVGKGAASRRWVRGCSLAVWRTCCSSITWELGKMQTLRPLQTQQSKMLVIHGGAWACWGSAGSGLNQGYRITKLSDDGYGWRWFFFYGLSAI